MSRIAILGASGKLGGHLVLQALGAGHQVHALTRDPRRIKKANEQLTTYLGDLESGEGLEPFLAGCRFVVAAVNVPNHTEAMATLVQAIGSRRVDRLVYVSWLGAGDSALQARKASGALASLRPVVQRGRFEDYSRAEELLRVSGLPYAIFRTTELTDEASGRPVEVVAADASAPPARVGRADLARFIIQSLEDPAWTMQEVTVGASRAAGRVR